MAILGLDESLPSQGHQLKSDLLLPFEDEPAPSGRRHRRRSGIDGGCGRGRRAADGAEGGAERARQGGARDVWAQGEEGGVAHWYVGGVSTVAFVEI